MFKKLIVLASLVTSFNAFAEDAPKEMYMKLDSEIGGYVTLTLEPCEIKRVSDPYIYKARIETNLGIERACWNTRDVPEGMASLVHVVEEVPLNDGTLLYNIGTFAQYYFSERKE